MRISNAITKAYLILQPGPHNLETGYKMTKEALAVRPRYMSLVVAQIEHKDDTELVKDEWGNILFPESIKHVAESKPISSALKCIIASSVSNCHYISVLSESY